MDKTTRNTIERATQQARKLLEEDFASQLEGTFDVLRSGVVPSKGGAHLSAPQRSQRDKIVAAIEHKRAAGMSAEDAVADYLRDAAFTTLNRFVALKMLEARELVQECITRGEQSAGYREFYGMAPGIALLPDATGYRLYIETLFDEFSTEIKVLFDRRDAPSVLWPKRQPFETLLAILNAQDLSEVWGVDETIGWVYQFFNSGEERRQMRDESSAPRNSRELAVRNQFFTPRYVVQFLTDNTLGRLWLEMHGGKTRLATICEYLVRSANEPDQGGSRKDPRDLRILDPACGSGHFLLYSFDLLLAIYEEAWLIEGAPKCEVTGRTLRDDYPDILGLRRAIPRLVVEHNLYGVDIDPRCAQIAALALWLRAQRAWKDLGVVAAERPRIQHTHIVVAEPMPGDKRLVEEFADRLDPPLLRDLFKKMIDECRLAGELGVLLRLEDAIATELRRGREQFAKQRQTTGFLPGIEPVGKNGDLDLSGIDDDLFFHEAESRIVGALRLFAETARGGSSVRRNLFAGDAAQGIALIDVTRTRFDVVLMNPPFGAATEAAHEYITRLYPYAKPDILASFLARARQLAPHGSVGAITNRTCLFASSLAEWRKRVLLDDGGLSLLVDLGHGVLDGALVEAACYVLSSSTIALACGLLATDAKDKDLGRAISQPSDWYPLDRQLLARLPNAAIAYWAPLEVLKVVLSSPTCEAAGLLPRVGLQTSDDFRFLRLQWEVAPDRVGRGRWVPFAKGGEYSPFADNLHLAVNWFNEAQEQKAFAIAHAERTGSARGNDASRDFEWYYSSGLTYSERTTSDISVRVLPTGCITGTSGPGIYSQTPSLLSPALGFFSTATFRQLLELSIGSGDAVESGSAARHYTVGNLAKCPFPKLTTELSQSLSREAERAVHATRELLAASPTAAGPVRSYPLIKYAGASLKSISISETQRRFLLIRTILEASAELERLADMSFEKDSSVRTFVVSSSGVHPCSRPQRTLDPNVVAELLGLTEDSLVDLVAKKCGFSRTISKKTWYADRRVELLCAYFDAHPSSVIQAALASGVTTYGEDEVAFDLLEHALGHALGDVAAKVQIDSWRAADSHIFDENWARSVRSSGKADCHLLADDPGNVHDVRAAISNVLQSQGWEPEQLLESISGALGVSDVRDALRRTVFSLHSTRFSRSRRKAPVYWQIATSSASYSVWIYLHAVTSDTFYKVQNEFVAPKLIHEERRLETIRMDAKSNGRAAERKQLADQEIFVEELRALLEEVKRVAALWNPELDDGVVITFAPLWRLVPHHNGWQKELRATWAALSEGEYDWAHLAMHLWPERVVPKCATDRSLAIAHGLENIFWVEGKEGNWERRTKPTRAVEELVRVRTSAAVQAALKSLLDAPAANANGSRGRGRRAANAATDVGVR